MKDASAVSAYAVYQKNKLKSNNTKVFKKQNHFKTKNDKKKYDDKIKSAVADQASAEASVIHDKKKIKKAVTNLNSINSGENGVGKYVKLVVEKQSNTKVRKHSKKIKQNHKTKITGQKRLKSTNNKINENHSVEEYNNIRIEEDDFLNSAERAELLFQWLLSPVSNTEFYKKNWEKKPLHIKRSDCPNYFKNIFSSEDLDTMLRENSLFYTRNVDVVTYCDGKRETHNTEGRATPSALWDYYSNGCSIRILNPQTYNDKVHLLLATLQEYFGSTMGVNVYLTPPGSQGFAPHWDDIEAFVLQLEGRKHWKLYAPKNQSQVLARYSSHNLSRDELGPLKYSLTVEAGDVLYFPRGTIHEACTDEDSHSLHITVSVYQNTSFADLLEQILPSALKKAAEEDVDFRKGLPLHYLKSIGASINQDSECKRQILSRVKNLMTRMLDHIDVDAAADQLGRKFMYDSLPPVLTIQEKLHSIRNDGEYLSDGKVYNRIEFEPDTEVRLLRQFCLRVVIQGNEAKIYYNTENARVYHGEDEQFLDIDLSIVPAITHLISKFPDFVAVEELPISADDLKLQIASDLWERGLLITKERLDCIDDTDAEY